MRITKPLLLAGLALSTSPALANIPAGEFYAGLQGGLNNFQSERQSTTNINTFFGTVVQKSKMNLGETGAAGGVYLGYEQPFSKQFFIAAELGGIYDSSEIKTTLENPGGFSGVTVNFKEKMQGDYSFSLLPGIKYKDSKLYTKFGVHRGKFKFESTGNTSFDQAFSGTVSEWQTGYSAGLGVGFSFSPYASLRLEYNYVAYDNITRSATDSFTGNTTKTKFTPNSNYVMLGLDIRFPTNKSFYSNYK